MKKLLRLSLFSTLLVALFGCKHLENLDSSQPRLPERPNILWIVAEDLSPIIPPYGDHTVETPYLSRLAEEGVRYTNVFSTSGVC